MLDQTFCDFLEGELTKAFANSENKAIQSFWCDGVLLPATEKEFSRKAINDTRQTSMSAFIGSSGQEEYKLLIRFGNASLSKYARGLDIMCCVPDSIDGNWCEVDELNKKLTVCLL